MNKTAQDNLRAQQQQYRHALIVLNGNRERGRIFFWVSLAVGLLVLVFLTAMGIWWMGAAIFVFVQALLGIPGLVGWRRAEGKIARIQAALWQLERTGAGGRAAEQPRPAAAAAYCRRCGKALTGAGLFCPSCGEKQ